MSQIPELVNALKSVLKSQNLTYADVAQALGLSEASIKRLFARKTFTLQRLEGICTLVGVELGELLELVRQERRRITALSFEQERQLASDVELLLVATCLRNHWGIGEILRQYALTEPQCIRALARLDRLGLIELLPGNRVRMRVAHNFAWIPGGPIETFFEEQVQPDFLADHFRGDDALRLFLTGHLSRSSAARFRARLEGLAVEFSELVREDSSLETYERHNVGVVLSQRNWELAAFAQMRR